MVNTVCVPLFAKDAKNGAPPEVLVHARSKASRCKKGYPTPRKDVLEQITGMLFWKVRISFYFINLLGVMLAVSGGEQYPFVAVQFLSHGAIGGVSAQIIIPAFKIMRGLA